MWIYPLMHPKFITGWDKAAEQPDPGMKSDPPDAAGRWPRFQPWSASREPFPSNAPCFNNAGLALPSLELHLRPQAEKRKKNLDSWNMILEIWVIWQESRWSATKVLLAKKSSNEWQKKKGGGEGEGRKERWNFPPFSQHYIYPDIFGWLSCQGKISFWPLIS